MDSTVQTLDVQIAKRSSYTLSDKRKVSTRELELKTLTHVHIG